MNKFWTYLNRGETNEFGRGVQTDLYRSSSVTATLHSVLVPDYELSYSCLCTEQLLQTVLNSQFESSLLEADPLNTYSRDIPRSPSFTNTIAQSYLDIEVKILDEYADGWTKGHFSVMLNPTLSKAQIYSSLEASTTVDFTIEDNMSSKIPLSKGLYMRFRNPLPVSPVTVTIDTTLEFRRNLNTVLSDLGKITIPWLDKTYRDVYNSSKIPTERVAAATMNLYRGLSNG